MRTITAAVFLATLAVGCELGAPPKKGERQEARKEEGPAPREERVRQEEKQQLPTKEKLRGQLISMKPDEVVALLGRPTEITPKGAVGCDVWHYRRQIASDHAAAQGKYDAWVYVERDSQRVIKVDF